MVRTIRRVMGRGIGVESSSIRRFYGHLSWAILGGNAKRKIAFSQLQIPVGMNQRSQPNQRLKLTQEEGLVGKYGTTLGMGEWRAQMMAWGYYSWSPVSLFFSINLEFCDFLDTVLSYKPKDLGC